MATGTRSSQKKTERKTAPEKKIQSNLPKDSVVIPTPTANGIVNAGLSTPQGSAALRAHAAALGIDLSEYRVISNIVLLKNEQDAEVDK